MSIFEKPLCWTDIIPFAGSLICAFIDKHKLKHHLPNLISILNICVWKELCSSEKKIDFLSVSYQSRQLSRCYRKQSSELLRWLKGSDLHVHIRMHIPHMATTLEIWSALPHSGLIRQSLVFRQHVGQPPFFVFLLSVSSCFLGWVCLVSWCFSSHSSLAPFPMMLFCSDRRQI